MTNCHTKVPDSFLENEVVMVSWCYNQKDQHSERAIQEYNSKGTSVDRMVSQRKSAHLSPKIQLAGETTQGRDLQPEIISQCQSTIK